MTREFNQKPRYDSRPPYRGSSSNNRYGAEQPSGPTRPRLNRSTVDRAWENGAPHRHADYKPRRTGTSPVPTEAGTNQTRRGPNTQKNWRNTQQSGHSSHDHAFYERGDSKRSSQYHDASTQPHRSDYSSYGYQGSRSRSPKPNNSFADQPPYRDQRGRGHEENTYRTRNGHPNFSHRPQEGNRGHYNQEPGRQENHHNGAYSYRTNPTRRANNGMEDYRDQRSRYPNHREAPYHDNRFEGHNGPIPMNRVTHPIQLHLADSEGTGITSNSNSSRATMNSLIMALRVNRKTAGDGKSAHRKPKQKGWKNRQR